MTAQAIQFYVFYRINRIFKTIRSPKIYSFMNFAELIEFAKLFDQRLYIENTVIYTRPGISID